MGSFHRTLVYMNMVIRNLITAFIVRVTSDGGTTEATASCMYNQLLNLNNISLLDSASLIITPNGFGEDIFYAVVPDNGDGDLTWTRASDAKRVNSERYIEDVAYNLIDYSEDFTTTWSTSGGAVLTPTSTTLIDGSTANVSALSGTTASSRVQQSLGVLKAGSHIQSVDVKYNGFDVRVSFRNNNFGSNNTFDLTSSSLIVNVAPDLVSIETLNNGWYRINILITANGTSTTFIQIRNNANSPFTGSYLINRAQVSKGSLIKSYLKTTDRLNIPRITYPPTVGCPSILSEPQRTQTATYSTDFTQGSIFSSSSSPTTGNSIVSSSVEIDPQGDENATLVTDDDSGGTGDCGIYYLSTVVVSNDNNCLSVFIKKGTKRWVYLHVNGYDGAVEQQWFDLDNGVLGSSTGGTFVSEGIKDYGNGWYRCWVVFTTTTDVNGGCRIKMADADGTTTCTLDGTSTMNIFGIQAEVGAYPTSYIETDGATATRLKDEYELTNVYTNNLITASGGAWFIELENNTELIEDAIGHIGLFEDASVKNNNCVFLNNANSSVALRHRFNVYDGASYSAPYITTTDHCKLIFNFDGTTADIWENGTKVVSALSLAFVAFEDFICNGADRPHYIKQQGLFPAPLTDDECEELSTL